MTHSVNIVTDCRLIGEFVDEAEPPPNVEFTRAEVVEAHLVASYVDLWNQDDGRRLFTVLLKDGRTVSVRGHALKQWQPTVSGDSGSFGVVIRAAREEVLVALFRTGEVVGIFEGELQGERKVA